MTEQTTENGTASSDAERPYIDLRRCQSMLDKYKAAMRLKQQQDQPQQEIPEASTETSSSDAQPAAPASANAAQCNDDDTLERDSAAAAAIAAADRQSYVDWDTMQKIAKKVATENDFDVVDSDTAPAISKNKYETVDTVAEQPIYSFVRRDRPTSVVETNNTATRMSSVSVSCQTSTMDVSENYNHSSYDGVYSRLAWASNSDSDTSLTQDAGTETEENATITVTSEGVVVPVKFVVRFVGSVPMYDSKLDTHTTKAVRRLCRRQNDESTELPSDVVRYWPTDVDLTLELSGKSLRLMDSTQGNEVFSQKLNGVRQWSNGPGKNSRNFMYVSREPTGSRFACHVFRCLGDCNPDDVLTALRQVCTEMQRLREETIRR